MTSIQSIKKALPTTLAVFRKNDPLRGSILQLLVLGVLFTTPLLADKPITTSALAVLPSWIPNPQSVLWNNEHPIGTEPMVSIEPQTVKEPGGYELSVLSNSALLKAHDDAGVRNGMQTWRQWNQENPKIGFTLQDAPALTIRGVHLDLKFHAPRFDWLMSWLDQLAEWKINTLIVEYEDKFPYSKIPEVADSRAWAPSQIKQFGEKAHALGIEVVPLIQTLGHLEFVLRLEKHQPLRENPENLSQLCPCHPQSTELIESMINEIAAAHPYARHLHIGGDETEWLGFCPECKRRAEELGGPVALYAEYIGRISRLALAHGLRPVIWDDILRKAPAEVKRLPHQAILMHWDYEANGTPLRPQKNNTDESLPATHSPPCLFMRSTARAVWMSGSHRSMPTGSWFQILHGVPTTAVIWRSRLLFTAAKE